MRLNGRGGEEVQSDDSGADGSRSPVESDQSDVSTPSTSSSSFCFKLAAALAADGRLAAQPIALRALQQAGALPEGMQLDASARDMLIERIAPPVVTAVPVLVAAMPALPGVFNLAASTIATTAFASTVAAFAVATPSPPPPAVGQSPST